MNADEWGLAPIHTAPLRAEAGTVIRVAVIDDHQAVRLGLEALLASEADMQAVGSASDAAKAWPLLYRTTPDVVIIDYRLPGQDGLTLCRRIKHTIPAPAVLLYSAFADDWLTVPAIVAGVDGIVHKAAPGRELADAIRSVAAGETALGPVRREFLSAAADALHSEDQPILGMLINGTSHQDIASTLGLDVPEIGRRLDRMLGALRTPVLQS